MDVLWIGDTDRRPDFPAHLELLPPGPVTHEALNLSTRPTDALSKLQKGPALKGSVFSLFESFVVDHYGEDTYDDILAATKLDTVGPFVGPGIYPASDLLALVQTTTDMLCLTTDAALRAFGRHAFPSLARSVPHLMDGATTPRDFLTKLESVIHTEVRKLDPAASPPRFTVDASDVDGITLGYQSPFGLFSLVAGFLDGVSDWYDQPLHHELIASDGTNGTFRIRFAGSGARSAGPIATSAGAHG